MQGTIKSVKADRGFGFIRRPGERDLFFHVRDTRFTGVDFDDRLVERVVEYELETGADDRPRAVRVRLI